MTNAHANSAPLRLLQITDTHCYSHSDTVLDWSSLPVQPNKNLQAILQHLQGLSPAAEALIISGDLAQEEVAGTYERIAELLQDYPLPVHILPGNHDVPELMQTHLSQVMSNVQQSSSLQVGNWHILFLDSSVLARNDGEFSDAQLAHLQAQLQAIPQQAYVVLFLHHHPVPINSPWMDPWGLQNADAFWQVLAPFPQVKAVVFGHIHNEFQTDYHREPSGLIKVYGTPSTCIQLGHDTDQPSFLHTRPAWRDLYLYADGRLDTQVNYLEETKGAT